MDCDYVLQTLKEGLMILIPLTGKLYKFILIYKFRKISSI